MGPACYAMRSMAWHAGTLARRHAGTLADRQQGGAAARHAVAQQEDLPQSGEGHTSGYPLHHDPACPGMSNSTITRTARRRAYLRGHTGSNGQRAAGNGQQAAGSRQQAAGTRYQATCHTQQVVCRVQPVVSRTQQRQAACVRVSACVGQGNEQHFRSTFIPLCGPWHFRHS